MTNQNDTQDEAERLAQEYATSKGWPTKAEWLSNHRDGLLAYEVRYETEEAFEAGYRAGVASKEAEIASLKHDLATKSSTDLISEKYRLREQLAASRAEVERLKQELIHETKGTAYCICGERGIEREFDYICEPCGRSWMSAKQIASYDLKLRVDLREQLAAEKALSQKLVECLEDFRILADNHNDSSFYHLLEKTKLKALDVISAYSTDSGDGEKG